MVHNILCCCGNTYGYVAMVMGNFLNRTNRQRITRAIVKRLSIDKVEENEEESDDLFNTSALQSFITQTYRGAALLEEHQVSQWLHNNSLLVTCCVYSNSSYFSVIFLQGFVAYQLPSNSVTWGSIFQDIEDNKERLGIVDYSISQTTLEQVRHSKWQCTQLVDWTVLDV